MSPEKALCEALPYPLQLTPRVAQRAQEIQAQVARLAEHMARFGALGAKASEATRILESLPPPYGTAQAAADDEESPVEKLVLVEGLLAHQEGAQQPGLLQEDLGLPLDDEPEPAHLDG